MMSISFWSLSSRAVLSPNRLLSASSRDRTVSVDEAVSRAVLTVDFEISLWTEKDGALAVASQR
jgi:hypothetical protein